MQQPLKLVSDIAPNRFLSIKRSTLTQDEKTTLIKLAFAVLKSRHRRGTALTSPADTKAYLQLLIGDKKNEELGIIFLDQRHRVIVTEILFTGTIDGASVYPRNVLARVLEINAASLVLFHNHPSGVTEPSQADISITKRLVDAMQLVNVRIIDHLIVSVEDSYSFAEHGLI